MALPTEVSGEANVSNGENILSRWITVAKHKREEYVRRQPIRTPLQVTERDPNYEGEPIKRSCTDVVGIVFFFVLIIVWIAGICYCAIYSDIGRVTNGYDSCGNICGETSNSSNVELERMSNKVGCNITCPLVTTNHTLVEFQKTDSIVYDPEEINRTCVEKCSPGFIQILRKCIPLQGTEIGNTVFLLVGYEQVAREIAEDLCAAWPYIIITILLCAVLSILILPALRYYAVYAIQIVLYITLVCTVIASVYCWTLFVEASTLGKVDEHGRDQKYTYLFTSVGSTVAAINVVVLMVAVKPKIKWVAELFTECVKAKISLPRLVLMPVSTFFLVSCIFVLVCYLAVVIESSGHLHYGKTVTIQKDRFMEFTKWYNFAAGLICIFFIVGFQDYVVASAVVYLFFSRGQTNLGYPVFRSIRLALRYHIGSIALFSSIVKVNAAVAAVCEKFSFKIASPCALSRFCCACLCKGSMNFLLALSERSYVTMSMFGMSFLRSGREAYLITFGYRSSFREVLETGRHLVFFVKILIVLIGFLVGHSFYVRIERIQHLGFLSFITMLFSFIIICCFTAVFELTLMALLICYCLDCQLNDGVEKPYYMSPELMAFVQRADINLKEVVTSGSDQKNKKSYYVSATSN